MKRYFIEHTETHLWWWPETDYSNPNYITTFIGSKIRVPGFRLKDGWTNDPNHFLVGYYTKEEAQHIIDTNYINEPKELLIITEHEFDWGLTVKLQHGTDQSI